MHLTPYQEQFTFRTLPSKSEKKILPVLKKKSFISRNELHLAKGFQKGMALGVLSHISGFGWVVGVGVVGGVARGRFLTI